MSEVEAQVVDEAVADESREEEDVENFEGENVPEDEVEGPDDDEDAKNPAYIPRKGKFYMHDSRKDTDEDTVGEQDRIEERKSRADKKWTHDLFDDRQQRPKTKSELVRRYGFDLRRGERNGSNNQHQLDEEEEDDYRGAPRRGRPNRSNRGQGARDNGQSREGGVQPRGGGSGGHRGGPPPQRGGRQQRDRRDRDREPSQGYQESPSDRPHHRERHQHRDYSDEDRSQHPNSRDGSSRPGQTFYKRTVVSSSFKQQQQQQNTRQQHLRNDQGPGESREYRERDSRPQRGGRGAERGPRQHNHQAEPSHTNGPPQKQGGGGKRYSTNKNQPQKQQVPALNKQSEFPPLPGYKSPPASATPTAASGSVSSPSPQQSKPSTPSTVRPPPPPLPQMPPVSLQPIPQAVPVPVPTAPLGIVHPGPPTTAMVAPMPLLVSAPGAPGQFVAMPMPLPGLPVPVPVPVAGPPPPAGAAAGPSYPHPRQPTEAVYFDPEKQTNVPRTPPQPRERRRLEIAPPAE